jgi:hypothetical protein
MQTLKQAKGLNRGDSEGILTFEGLREMESTCDFLLNKGTFVSMRTRMDLMLSMNMLLRGEDRRRLEMPEVLMVLATFAIMGPNPHVPALGFQLLKGKV